jgi:TPR repeat/Tetratricopeptide repeat
MFANGLHNAPILLETPQTGQCDEDPFRSQSVLESRKTVHGRRRTIWAWRVLLLGLALPLFWPLVSTGEDCTLPAAGPSPTLVASEAGPSPSPTPTPPRTAPENASFAAAFKRGWDAANERRYHDAITEYNEAIQLKPDDPSVYNNRGFVYQILKQYPQAIVDYNVALALNAESADLYNARGQTYLALKQYSKAVADCTAAIGLRPGFAEAYYNRGLAYDRLKQHDKAAADYSEVIRLKHGQGEPL